MIPAFRHWLNVVEGGAQTSELLPRFACPVTLARASIKTGFTDGTNVQ